MKLQGDANRRLRRAGGRQATWGLAVCFVLSSAFVSADDRELYATAAEFFSDYCFACHDASAQEAGVNLELFSIERDLYTHHELVEAVLEHVDVDRDMPPEESDQPSDEERLRFVRYLRNKLEHPDPAIVDDPGFVPAHRLSNRQYRNTIRDLIGVGMEVVDDFPADEAVDGFDHMASALAFSSMHMERYVAAANYIVDRAFPPETPTVVRREAEDLPYLQTFGRKEYERNATLPDGHPKSEVVDGVQRIYYSGGVTVPIVVRQSGYYEVRIRTRGRTFGGPVGGRFEVLVDGKAEVMITHLRERAKKLTELSTRLIIRRGEHDVRLAFEGMNTDADPPPKGQVNFAELDWIEIVGPISENPKMHEQIARQLIPVRPSESVPAEEAMRKTLGRFVSRAFRRPQGPKKVDQLIEFSGLRDGVPFDAAVQRAMVAALASPSFLMHTEATRSPTETYEIGPFELASRLSYFLWSTMPDGKLMDAAGRDELHDPAVLAAQVDRMLADDKAAEFARAFAPQWLGLGSLFSVDRDGKKFRKFIRQRRGIREAMLNEVVLVCDEVFRTDRSLLELLDTDFTYVNRDTAEQYGIDGVKSRDMQRVSLTGELALQRGGLPTMSAVLMSISHPSDTNPSGRGKWILDALLGTPPPPPPPDVQPLPKPDKDTSKLTLRERLAAHRDDPNCASCHEKIDPLGFALENYDQNGTWRVEEAGRPVETQATLPDGTRIDGVQSLKRLLVEQKRELFLRHFSERVLAFALRRGLQFHDRATVNECVRVLNEGDAKFRDLVITIVTSDSFRSQRLPVD